MSRVNHRVQHSHLLHSRQRWSIASQDTTQTWNRASKQALMYSSYLFMLHACINSNINIETSLAPQQPPMTKGSFPKTPQPTSGTTITSASKTLGQLLSKEDYNNSLIDSHVAMHTSKCLRLSAWINDFHFWIFAYQICITVIGRHWSHTA